jgi:lysozyme
MINIKTEKLIKRYESLHDGDLKQIGLQPKADPLGYFTEGWGRLMIDPLTKKPVTAYKRALALQTIHTIEEADLAFIMDIRGYENEVEKVMSKSGVSLNENQYGALTSLCYNAGGLAMIKTFNRVTKKDVTQQQVKDAFGLYIKGKIKGVYQTLPGLVKRRLSEAELFLGV